MGTEAPFLHRAKAASFPKASFQHGSMPPAEPAPDRLRYWLFDGAQLSDLVAVGQEEQDPQDPVYAVGHALKHYF